MQTIVEALGIVLGLVLLWTGVKRVRIHSYVAAVITFMDFGLLVVATVYLGWLGLLLFIIVNAIALVVTSVRLASRKEELLTYASTQFDVEKQQVYELFDRVRGSHRVWTVLGQINCAEFIAAISQRGRSVSEAETMLVPIALLWFNDRRRIDIEALTEKFDRLMRLTREPADEAMRVADVLTQASRQSAASFSDMLDAMLSLYSHSD